MAGKHSRRRPWWKRPTTLLGALLIVVVAAAIGVWLATRTPSPSRVGTASTSTPTELPTSTNPPASSVTDAPTTASTSSTTAPATTVAPTTTTVRISPPVSTPDGLTYTISAGTKIAVAAIRACWIEVRPSANGPVTTIETLPAGQTLNLSSPVWIRLGDPTNVQVSAGTTRLQLPRLSADLIIQAG